MNRRTLIGNGLWLGAGLAGSGLLPQRLMCQNPAAPSSNGTGSLKAHAAAKGLLTGCAVDMRLLANDEAYQKLLTEQYNILVGENCMKFGPMQPKVDSYNFADADALVQFAQAHSMKLRGHNFVWHENLPAWFAGTVTKENARKILTDHIRTIGGRYKGKIHSWDVVNEAIWVKDGRPDGLRSSSPWFQMLGPEYLDLAFRTARQADPTALLTYNDYGIEYDSDDETLKRASVLAMLRKLKADGVPIDALGVQSHLHASGKTGYAKGLAELMQGAHALGLQIFITEMDVKDDDLPSDDLATRDVAVAMVYGDYVQHALRSTDVKAILTWGVSDGHTWLNHGTEFRKQHPTRLQRPLPFDAENKPKPAFFAMRDAFDASKSR